MLTAALSKLLATGIVISSQIDGWAMCVQVVKGADVVQMIEKTKTDRFDKPFEDIKIVNIEIKMSVD